MDHAAPPDEISALWKALYTLAGVCSTVALLLVGYIQQGKRAIWARLNQQGDAAAEARREDALTFAKEEAGRVPELCGEGFRPRRMHCWQVMARPVFPAAADRERARQMAPQRPKV